jgi:ABC-type transport system substrate-binding protein
MNAFRKAILAATCVGSLVAVAAPALAQTTLRAVMHSDLKILDPIWTTAYIVRNHGYMIYDTLLAQDEKGDIKPQMVEKYEAAADGKSYTFTLRDGLLWHDGKPVTSEDCIASIKRWAVKDSLGQKMMTFVDSIDAVDAKTFTIKLKEPTGLVLLGLSKPSSNVPFMMPKRVADTDPNRSRILRDPDPSSSSRMNGSRATRPSTSSSTSTSRAPSRPRVLPAASSPRWIASSGAPFPTRSKRSTRCKRARSTTSSSPATISWAP